MPDKNSYRILVADDVEEIRELLKEYFRRNGHKCDTVRDGVAAENMLSVYKYDLVVTDLAMPKLNGHKLVQNILSKPNPPMIIAITGVADPRIVSDLIQRGVDDVIMKPLVPSVFVAKTLAMLEVRAPVGDAAGSSPEQLAKRIAGARTALEDQLSRVTSSFQETIASLQKQQEAMEAGLMGSVRLFTGLLGKLGSTGSSHAGRVEAIAEQLGTAHGLAQDQVRELKLAALLHDIGQFGMPDDIREASPWALNDKQREVYQLYPELGAALLAEVPGLQSVAAIIQAHRENYDGTGFPQRLRGEQIPIEARILHIADGCDLAYMQRRAERPVEMLREHLQEQSGKAYDPALIPQVVPVLTDVYRRLIGKPVAMRADELPDTGYVLAEDIYDAQGHFLARSGAQVTAQMRKHLQGFLQGGTVYVRPVGDEGSSSQ